MTLRGVIQGLMRGADDPGSDSAEAMLADQGFGDLPAEMFGQALASYADTAPMAEADALTPILASLESGDPSDVFAVLDQQPLTVEADPGAGAGLAGASLLGTAALDDTSDDGADLDGADLGAFGESVVDADLDESPVDAGADDADSADGDVEDSTAPDAGGPDQTGGGIDEADPFATAVGLSEVDDDGTDGDSFEDLFDSEPQATGDDPADLDLDF